MYEIQQQYNPDILSFIANLSSDEVFTPPSVVNQMLNLLPEYIWQDEEITFLDPTCKSGVFLREISKRLLRGLEQKIPNIQERINHIYTKQLYGIAITELTALLSRRSVYCSRFANSKYSVATTFDTPEGNIIFNPMNHTWHKGKCAFCGARQSLYDRSNELESHAYQFIHINSLEEMFNMKFDIIIGNPPYQLSDAGDSTGSSPIYQLFVEQAKKLNPRYMTMIIPSRWFAGGKGLDGFRDAMLNDCRISHLVDHPIASDIFPGVKVIGGICYFFWDKNYNGQCKVTTKMNGSEDTMERSLNQFDTFVRFNKAISILEKVQSKKYNSMSENVSRQKPFGLRTFERPSGRGTVTLYANKVTGNIEKSVLTTSKDLIDKWKVFISRGYGEAGETREYPRMIMGKPIVAPPPSACTETYIIVGVFDNENNAQNLASYLRTKFVRFLVGLRKNTQDITKDRFAFVPNMPMDKTWTDKKLYSHFGLTKQEIDFIEAMIRPME
jgi:site-specific DNA-methyltransferase (adenine-specific)